MSEECGCPLRIINCHRRHCLELQVSRLTRKLEIYEGACKELKDRWDKQSPEAKNTFSYEILQKAIVEAEAVK